MTLHKQNREHINANKNPIQLQTYYGYQQHRPAVYNPVYIGTSRAYYRPSAKIILQAIHIAVQK